MRSLIFSLTLVTFIVLTTTSMLNAQSDGALSTTFYNQFDTDDGLARAVAFRDFELKVPDDEKTNVLAQMLKQSLSASKPDFVASSVFGYLTVKKLKQTDKLSALMSQCATSPNVPTREAYLNFLVNHKKPEDAPVVVGFLDDGNDSIRQKALDYVIKLDGGKAKVSEYITKHQSDGTYSKSIERAQHLLQTH